MRERDGTYVCEDRRQKTPDRETERERGMYARFYGIGGTPELRARRRFVLSPFASSLPFSIALLPSRISRSLSLLLPQYMYCVQTCRYARVYTYEDCAEPLLAGFRKSIVCKREWLRVDWFESWQKSSRDERRYRDRSAILSFRSQTARENRKGGMRREVKYCEKSKKRYRIHWIAIWILWIAFRLIKSLLCCPSNAIYQFDMVCEGKKTGKGK